MYWKSPCVGEPTWNMQGAFADHGLVLWKQVDGLRTAGVCRGASAGWGWARSGTRTWGGEIWLTGSNAGDRGVATAAEMSASGPEGKWLIEGPQVDLTSC